jgi:hypothetical protein
MREQSFSAPSLLLTMPKECSKCGAIIPPARRECTRCNAKSTSVGATIARRAAICAVVCVIVLLGFYISLISSADKLSAEQMRSVERSIAILRDAGFTNEAFLLSRLTAFRSNDNWLNASVVKENAYAATNFPFEIVTLYPDFFTMPQDDIERAVILLHEAKHLQGEDEAVAYSFVWKSRYRLGWTRDKYANSIVWQNVRRQTKEYHPELFTCTEFHYNDCTEASF